MPLAGLKGDKKLTQPRTLVQVSYQVPVNTTRKGLSEKIIRKKLEKKGWMAWRGGMIHVREHEYQNVEKKYKLLADLLEEHKPGTLEQLRYLSSVHHGMPDYICFRDRKFKFVECKLSYECLSETQKKCIKKLQQMGFDVEVHRLVDKQTRDGTTLINLAMGTKCILQQQKKLKAYS